MNVIRPPPSVAVPLPVPPTAAVPPTPAAVVPTRSTMNGVVMDMTESFVSNSSSIAGKRAVPPWERRNKALMQPGTASPITLVPSNVPPASADAAAPASAPTHHATVVSTTVLTSSALPPPLDGRSSAVGVASVPSPSTAVIVAPPVTANLLSRTNVDIQTTESNTMAPLSAMTIVQSTSNELKSSTAALPPRSAVVVVPSLPHMRLLNRSASQSITKESTYGECVTDDSTIASTAFLRQNRYDLQPSPSAVLHHTLPTALTAAAQVAQERDAAHQRTMVGAEWRGVYWRHVDVHRYITRRYLGGPPAFRH